MHVYYLATTYAISLKKRRDIKEKLKALYSIDTILLPPGMAKVKKTDDFKCEQ
jgi:hypothetical protein